MIKYKPVQVREDKGRFKVWFQGGSIVRTGNTLWEALAELGKEYTRYHSRELDRLKINGSNNA